MCLGSIAIGGWRLAVDGVGGLLGSGTTTGRSRQVGVEGVVCITITARNSGCCNAVGCFVGRHILQRLQE